MAIQITDQHMTSDRTAETATWDEQAQAWRVSSLPGATWTRTQATSAMVIAERQAAGDTASPFVLGLRAQLGI